MNSGTIRIIIKSLHAKLMRSIFAGDLKRKNLLYYEMATICMVEKLFRLPQSPTAACMCSGKIIYKRLFVNSELLQYHRIQVKDQT